jgi:hypothetical protein
VEKAAEPIPLLRRQGKFTLDTELIKNELRKNKPESLMAFFGRMVVVRCEVMFAEGYSDYTALSPEFEPVPFGCVIPYYDIIYSYDDEKKLEISFGKRR